MNLKDSLVRVVLQVTYIQGGLTEFLVDKYIEVKSKTNKKRDLGTNVGVVEYINSHWYKFYMKYVIKINTITAASFL